MGIAVPDESFCKGLAGAVTDALKRLLSEKHLYQSVDVDESFISRIASEKFKNAEDRFIPSFGSFGSSSGYTVRKVSDYSIDGERVLNGLWIPAPGSTSLKPGGFSQTPIGVGFDLPTILTFCHHCKERWPCNPLRTPEILQIGASSHSEQWFFLSYVCQTCKKDAIRFLVRRSGKKLTLSGRDPIEALPPPKVLPKKSAKFFGDAVIAHHAGQTLAGIFLLRVFIEQFWLSVPEVASLSQNGSRLSGDELGETYKATLPDDFKKRFPTLLDTYSNLSAAMHKAEASAETFDKSREEIVTHFEARRIFKLILPEKAESPACT